MIIKTGNYTGSGVAKEITTGNNPDIIFVKCHGNTAGAIMRTSTMAADSAKVLNDSTALFTGAITSITATGFTVGTVGEVNTDTIVYEWWAIECDGTDGEVGSYTGDGIDNRDITLATVTGTPAWVVVLGNTTEYAFHRTNVHAAGASGWFTNAADHAATGLNGIQAFGAGTFQVGTRDNVNTNAITYHYIALTEVADKFQVVTYTGNNTDDQSVTGAGFTPTFSMHQARHTPGRTMIVRGPGHVGDSSSFITATADAANMIQAFEADGHQIGTHANVNDDLDLFAALFFKSSVAGGASPGNSGNAPGRGRGNPNPGGGGGNGGAGGGGGGGPIGNPLRKAFWGKRRRTR